MEEPTPVLPTPQNQGSLYVWDPLVRICHWSLVTIILLNFFVIDGGDLAHEVLGYIAAGLVVLRVIWGFVGTFYARFKSFFPTPRRLKEHLGHMRRKNFHAYIGHDPWGAFMMLFLLFLVLCLGVTGYMMGTDPFWGEEWLQNLHHWLADILIAASLIHALAAIGISILSRTNLIAAMWTGIKKIKY